MIMIKKSKDEKYFFEVIAKNSEILVTSETYESLQNAKKGITALKKAMTGRVKINVA